MDTSPKEQQLLSPQRNGGTFRIRTDQGTSASAPMGSGLSGRRGVPLAVPLPFLLTGVIAAALSGLLAPWVLPLALQAPDASRVLALVHTITLGWLTMTIMGATLQLVPVIVVAPLRAGRLLRWQYPVFVCGVVGLISGFWWGASWLLITGGAIIALAVVHYVVVLGTTLLRADTRPLTVLYLLASLAYLCLVVSLGLTAASNLATGFLGSGMTQILLGHVVLGVTGWLSCTLVGVSYTLGRLFLLAHTHDDRWGRVVLVLLNGGIVLLASGCLLNWSILQWSGGTLLLSAAALFAGDCIRMLRVRQRKRLEVTQYHSLAATGYFVLALGGGLLVLLPGNHATPAILTALGLAVLIGWLGQSVVGYLYKIVPFLIWSERYGPLLGTRPVPLMRDMIHQRWAWGSWWLINASLPVLIGAALLQQVLVLQLAAGALATGLLLVALNLLLAARHLVA